MKNKKGFTLVELLAVIAILAILVIIALPNVMGMFNEAKKKYNDPDRNIIRITNSPFEYVVVPKQQATRKRAITPAA